MVEERNENGIVEEGRAWNALAKQEAVNDFLHHVGGYIVQIKQLEKQDFTSTDKNLSQIAKVATDAEVLDVLNQMNETQHIHEKQLLAFKLVWNDLRWTVKYLIVVIHPASWIRFKKVPKSIKHHRKKKKKRQINKENEEKAMVIDREVTETNNNHNNNNIGVEVADTEEDDPMIGRREILPEVGNDDDDDEEEQQDDEDNNEQDEDDDDDDDDEQEDQEKEEQDDDEDDDDDDEEEAKEQDDDDDEEEPEDDDDEEEDDDDEEEDENYEEIEVMMMEQPENQQNSEQITNDIILKSFGVSQKCFSETFMLPAFNLIQLVLFEFFVNNEEYKNTDLWEQWKWNINNNRKQMRFQYDSISATIIRNTSNQMNEDINMIVSNDEDHFKKHNKHQIKKKMDKMTYSVFYVTFADHEWQKEWKKKGAHTGHWPVDKLKLYTIKLRRLVLMKCYIWLEEEKETFFAKIEASKNS